MVNNEATDQMSGFVVFEANLHYLTKDQKTYWGRTGGAGGRGEGRRG